MRKILPVSVAALLLGATAALAQDPSVPQRGQDTDPKLPPSSQTIPDKVRPESGGTGPTLSEKLEKSDGVIKPSNDADPAIRAIPPDPDPNSTPVIKPPNNAK